MLTAAVLERDQISSLVDILQSMKSNLQTDHAVDDSHSFDSVLDTIEQSHTTGDLASLQTQVGTVFRAVA